MCWGIWRVRCKFTFEHCEIDVIKCVEGAVRMVKEYWAAMERKDKRSAQEKQKKRKLKWERPTRGKMKINVDAAFDQKRRKAAVGVVGRDWKGRFMGGFSSQVEAESAFQAESLALLQAVKNVDLWGSEGGEMETDCAELFGRLKEKRLEGCEWGSVEILQECLSLLAEEKCKDWEISLVAREGNKAADNLAAMTMRGVVLQGWLYQPPPSLTRILEEDSKHAQRGANGREGIG